MIWPAVAIYLIPVGVFFFQGLCSTFDPDADLITTFLTAGFLALWIMVAVLILAYTLVTRSWARCVSMVLAVLLVWPSFRPVARLPDYVHLAVMWPTYMKQVDANHQTQFDWGMGGMVTALFRKTLVYDPTDGLTEENFEPRTFDRSESIAVMHLIGHFYLVNEAW